MNDGKLPIPNDWDKSKWECFTIKWPNSDEYRAILLGLMYSLTRGRTYNGETGIITDAQKIGWEIFNRNYPLIKCGTTGDNPSAYDGGYDCSGQCGDCSNDSSYDCDELESVNMGCCISNLRWNGGVLEFQKCGEWFPVSGATSDVTSGLPPVDDGFTWENEPGEGNETFSYACAKATAIVELLITVTDAFLTVANDGDFWNFVNKMEARTGIRFNEAFLLGALNTYVADMVAIRDDMDDWLNENDHQREICEWTQRLSDSARITDSDWGKIKNWLDYVEVPGIMEQSMLMKLIAAVGRSNFDRAALAAANGDLDCGCQPEPPTEPEVTIPTSHTWAKDWNFLTSNGGWFIDNQQSYQGWQANKGWYSTDLANYKSPPNIGKYYQYQAGQVLTWVYVELTNTFPGWYGGGGSYAVTVTGNTNPVPLGQWLSVPTVQIPLYMEITPNNWPRVILFGGQLYDGTGGEIVIKRVILAGVGPDPFPNDPNFAVT